MPYFLIKFPFDARQSIEKAFEIVDKNISESAHTAGAVKPFARGEFSKDQWHDYKADLLHQFHENDIAYVISKSPFDLLLRTDQASPKDCYAKILEYVNSLQIKNNILIY